MTDTTPVAAADAKLEKVYNAERGLGLTEKVLAAEDEVQQRFNHCAERIVGTEATAGGGLWEDPRPFLLRGWRGSSPR